MNSEKVKEIKKALECCSVRSGNCDKCPFIKEGFDCDLYLLMDALKLINELESENSKFKAFMERNDWESIEDMETTLDKAQEKCFEVAKENQQLKDRIAELEKEKTCIWEEWTDGDHSIWCCSNCKEDFCFIEGDVYENNYGYCPHCGAKITALKEMQEEEIDETLKEFMNADK